jgi:hypothetical protein
MLHAGPCAYGLFPAFLPLPLASPQRVHPRLLVPTVRRR